MTSLTFGGAPSVSRKLPFLESLLSFLEMDYETLAPMLRRITEDWIRLIAEDEQQAGTSAMVELGQLKQRRPFPGGLHGVAEELLRPQDRKSGTDCSADLVFFVYDEADSCPRMAHAFSANR